MSVFLSLNNFNDSEMTYIFQSQTDHTWRSWRTLCICCRHTGSHFLSWCNVMPSTYFPSQNVATGIEIYIFKHLKWCFGWFSGFFKVYIRPRLFSRHSHITECTECVCVCVCDSWLTLTAIWFHYAGHRSDAFYDRSQYIPQAWAEREREEKRRTHL